MVAIYQWTRSLSWLLGLIVSGHLALSLHPSNKQVNCHSGVPWWQHH